MSERGLFVLDDIETLRALLPVCSTHGDQFTYRCDTCVGIVEGPRSAFHRVAVFARLYQRKLEREGSPS